MPLTKVIAENSRIWGALRCVTLISLLALYIAGGTGYELFHTHQSLVSHTTEEEEDPCHRAIYHAEKDNACTHQSHVSANETCCECDLLCHADQLIVRGSSIQAVSTDGCVSGILLLSHVDNITVNHPSRGPPAA